MTDNRDVRGDVRGEIREFLSTRRGRITPVQAGLPVYGGDRRRVSGLRRDEVALLAGSRVSTTPGLSAATPWPGRCSSNQVLTKAFVVVLSHLSLTPVPRPIRHEHEVEAGALSLCRSVRTATD